MAKKRTMPHGRTAPRTKRLKTRDMIATPAERQEEQPDTPAITSPASAPITTAPRSAIRAPYVPRAGRGGGQGLSTDYQYVIADLKRIGVIAGATLAILFGLTFVVR